jgi:hypothetical protein
VKRYREHGQAVRRPQIGLCPVRIAAAQRGPLRVFPQQTCNGLGVGGCHDGLRSARLLLAQTFAHGTLAGFVADRFVGGHRRILSKTILCNVSAELPVPLRSPQEHSIRTAFIFHCNEMASIGSESWSGSLRLWTGYPLELPKEDDHADS